MHNAGLITAGHVANFAILLLGSDWVPLRSRQTEPDGGCCGNLGGLRLSNFPLRSPVTPDLIEEYFGAKEVSLSRGLTPKKASAFSETLSRAAPGKEKCPVYQALIADILEPCSARRLRLPDTNSPTRTCGRRDVILEKPIGKRSVIAIALCQALWVRHVCAFAVAPWTSPRRVTCHTRAADRRKQDDHSSERYANS